MKLLGTRLQVRNSCSCFCLCHNLVVIFHWIVGDFCKGFFFWGGRRGVSSVFKFMRTRRLTLHISPVSIIGLKQEHDVKNPCVSLPLFLAV